MELNASRQEGKNILHRFTAPSYNQYMSGKFKKHIFKGSDCWCDPVVSTDWTKATKRGEPFIFVEHRPNG